MGARTRMTYPFDVDLVRFLHGENIKVKLLYFGESVDVCSKDGSANKQLTAFFTIISSMRVFRVKLERG